MKKFPLVLMYLVIFLHLFFFKQSVFAQMNTKTKLSNIGKNYEQAYFKRYPELALFWGRTDSQLDRFTDKSLQALYEWRKTEDQFLDQLKALPIEELQGTPEFHTYQLLKQKLENEQAIRICKEELWAINPLGGWHNIAVTTAEKQPVGTPEYRNLAIVRWNTFGKLVDEEIKNLRLGLKEGYSAPKPVVERVIKQLTLILNTPIEENPFFEFAKRDGDVVFKRKIAEIIENVIHPAIKRYTQYLQNEYLPLARKKVGISALPNGMQCYQAKILKETTLSLEPEAIYQFGLEHMQQLIREVAIIGQREYGMKDIAQIFKEAKKRSTNFFQNEQDILNYNQLALNRANAKVDAWFDKIPKAQSIIKPYPMHRAQTGAAGEYHPPSEDGKRPGIFYINTYQPQNKSRIDQEATLFHELVPGHHYQVARQLEDKHHLNIDKYLWNTGFGEGWALYSERLADEMGLYQDDISRLGMLSNEALRTARLVVDPGLHVLNWSREKAINYLKQHTAMETNIIEAEVDRYIMMPAQATGYMLGKREIDNLRNLAKSTLGEKFDIRQFHAQVLKNGTVTLPMLRIQIDNWITTHK